MLALQVTAIVFLLLSATLMFGPQLAVYGARAVPMLARNDQARFVSGCLTSALVMTVFAPQFGGALSSGSGAISVVMADVLTMSFHPV